MLCFFVFFAPVLLIRLIVFLHLCLNHKRKKLENSFEHWSPYFCSFHMRICSFKRASIACWVFSRSLRSLWKPFTSFCNSFSTLLIFACQSSSFLSHSARIISLFILSSVIHGGSFSSSIWTGRNRILNDFVYHQSFKCSWIGESQKYLPHSKRVLRSLIHRLLQRMALPIILSAIVIVRRLVYLVLLEVAVGVNVMLSDPES